MSHPLLITSLRKSFPLANDSRQVLKGLTLHIAAGEVVAVLGENGCGKSTLLRCIMGIERPDSGSITHGTSSVPSRGVRVAFVTQNSLDSVFPSLTVSENISLATQHSPGFAFSFPGLGKRDYVRREATTWGLDGSLHVAASELSGGQQQRLALLLVLLRQPHVLLLDEITANLDARGSELVETALFPNVRRLRIPTVVVTHDLAFARRVAHRLVTIDNGVLRGAIDSASGSESAQNAQGTSVAGSAGA
jgi:ABC-type sulfate/molybdate transport systems ATPase subunit